MMLSARMFPPSAVFSALVKRLRYFLVDLMVKLFSRGLAVSPSRTPSPSGLTSLSAFTTSLSS